VIIELFDHDSSVELDQVLKDQPAPTISARLHKQSAFGKPAKFDRHKTELFRELTDLRCSVFIVARQEHDSPATMDGWIMVKSSDFAHRHEADDRSFYTAKQQVSRFYLQHILSSALALADTVKHGSSSVSDAAPALL